MLLPMDRLIGPRSLSIRTVAAACMSITAIVVKLGKVDDDPRPARSITLRNFVRDLVGHAERRRQTLL
jgi:hypothetical protein